MKKLLLKTSLFAAMTVMFTSCLKDKGFDNGTYGINDPDSQPPGVGFALGAKTQAFGLDVSASAQAVNGMVYVNLLTGNPATADVLVNLTNNTTAMVAAYNTANGLTGSNTILEFPSALYTVGSSITVPSGARNAQIPINISSTTSLNPVRSYAIGLTISAVNGGYQIANNLKNLLIIFNIKNRLDGHYEITGVALRAGDPVLTGAMGPYEVDLETSGANAVQWHVGSPVYWGGMASQLPGGYEPLITVDPVTNLITNITSAAGIVMNVPIVRTDIIGATQRYNPATKTLHFEFTYGGGPTSRLFSLNARWLRAR
jgi:hypothetical protein